MKNIAELCKKCQESLKENKELVSRVLIFKNTSKLLQEVHKKTATKIVEVERNMHKQQYLRTESVMYPEGFSYQYTSMGTQILMPKRKNETCISIHDFFLLKAMFLQFNPKKSLFQVRKHS